MDILHLVLLILGFIFALATFALSLVRHRKDKSTDALLSVLFAVVLAVLYTYLLITRPDCFTCNALPYKNLVAYSGLALVSGWLALDEILKLKRGKRK